MADNSQTTEQTVAEWLAQGHKITICNPVHLVRSQHPDELPAGHGPPLAKPKAPRGGGWAAYHAKRRAKMEAFNG